MTLPEDVLICAPVRTPHGRYGGSLRDVPAVDLGVVAATGALERAALPAEQVDELVVSNCRQAGNGPNPGRQIGVRAGLPEPVPAQTINMACASGLMSLEHARRSLLLDAAQVALVVAVESMSTMPYLAPSGLRWDGVRRGDITLVDGWRDGGTDPVCGLNMGETAENVAATYGIERRAQDDWAHRSHQRVAAAWADGRFGEEVVAVDHERGRLDRDETFREDSQRDKLDGLRPAFVPDGSVTAGNASQMADGAAAMVVATRSAAASAGIAPVGRVHAFASVGVDPAHMGIGPTVAIPAALEQAGLTREDIALFEINEAFGAQIVHNVRTLGLDPDRVNVNGGGIALGHPTGQSGARVVVTLLHELRRRGERYGVASLCVGGGMGVAAVVERVDA